MRSKAGALWVGSSVGSWVGKWTGIVFFALGGLSPLVEARETELFFDVAQATESPLGKSRLLSIPFYMKGGDAPVAVKLLSTWTQERASSGVMRTDKKTCDVAFLSALIALQESAQKEGGDAIVNIVSSTKGKTTESASQYRCIAGTTIAHVALSGDVIKTQ